jgi:tetratricopeptide (TPR) repeat protein
LFRRFFTLYRLTLIFIILLSCCIYFDYEKLIAQESNEKIEFEYGERLFMEEHFDLAAKQFQIYLEKYPYNPQKVKAQYLLAEAYFYLNQYQLAQEEYMKLIIKYTDFPHNDQIFYQLGLCFKKMGKFKEAVVFFKRIYENFPDSKWAMEGLYCSAELLLEKKEFYKAESTLYLLLEIISNYELRSKAIFLLSSIYKSQGKFEDAIQVLSPLLKKIVSKNNQAEAAFHIGDMFSFLGRSQDSEDYNNIALSLTDDINLKQKACFKLGDLLCMKKKYADAKKFYTKASNFGENNIIKSDALFNIGKIETKIKNFNSACKFFNYVIELNVSDQNRIHALYEKAYCLEALGKYSDAILIYKSIISVPSFDSTITKLSFLATAKLYFILNNFEFSIDFYNQYVKLFQTDKLIDAVLLKKGKILLKNLEFISDALESFRILWNNFPNSPYIPEAMYFYAEGLEKLNRIEDARNVYMNIRRQYNGSYWDVASMIRLEEIEQFRTIDYKKGIIKVFEIIEKSLSCKIDSFLFDLGLTALNDFKEYEYAVQIFKKYLSFNLEEQRINEALLYLGKCYEALFIINSYPSYLDSAKSIYYKLCNNDKSNFYSVEPCFNLIKLDSELAPLEKFRRYKKLIHDFPENNIMDKIYYQIGMSSIEADSIESALMYFKQFLIQFGEGPYLEEVHFRTGKIYMENKQYDKADSIFTEYEKVFPEGQYKAEVFFYKANLAIKSGEYEEALSRLEKISIQYFYSQWADSSLKLLGKLYLISGTYNQALNFYKSAIEEDSIRNVAVSMGLIDKWLSKRKIFLLGLADSYFQLKQFKNAKELYLKYGRENSHYKDNRQIYYNLARIAAKEGNLIRAINYLEDIVEEFPSDSIHQEIGIYLFETSQYDKAISSFQDALKYISDEESKLLLNKYIIISFLREDDILKADTKIKNLKKFFNRNSLYQEYMAEILLEKGLALIRDKEFDSAIELYENIIQRFKNTSFLPQAEFEIGRVYLITNKIEKALKILTTMPDRYPDHPILAKVYVNLGDHYYRSQQFENALTVFKTVINGNFDDNEIPVAMRYLIKVYDSIRMWDAALLIIRDYINRFPNAEDVLQKQVQIGIFYMNLKDYLHAIEYFRELKIDADSDTETEIQYWIGKCYYNLGQFENAIFEFLKVKYISKPTKLPWAATALFEAGQLYLKIDKPIQAKKLFKQVVLSEGSTSDLGRIARKKIDDINNSQTIK